MSFEMPNLNRPVVDLGHKFPMITWWMVLYAILGLLIYIVVMISDRNKHKCHKNNHKKLKSHLNALQQRFDAKFPPTPKPSFSSSSG